MGALAFIALFFGVVILEQETGNTPDVYIKAAFADLPAKVCEDEVRKVAGTANLYYTSTDHCR